MFRAGVLVSIASLREQVSNHKRLGGSLPLLNIKEISDEIQREKEKIFCFKIKASLLS
jgi:hypothetical protein